MSKEQIITGNIQPPNKDLEFLKQKFPNCFDKNGAFDFEKFKTQLSKNEINFSKESYGMDWLGKSYARLLATDETTTLLKEDETFNQKEENENSENLLIKGDNLEVLKHLSNAYYEKIKMIYIDPPYNTGSDGFVYADDRTFTIEELQELAGINEERAKRILDFTQSKSNSHSAWLTFMYPRLYIAKQLLKEDGVIFISIDENELTQLRLLLDEIFGEENFIECICWNKRIPKNDKGVGNIHEYILVYVKNSELKPLFTMRKDGLDDIYEIVEKLKKNKISLPESEKLIKKLYKKNAYDRGITLYNSLSEDYRLWGKINMSWPNADTFGPTYEVKHPITKKPVNIPDRGWRWKEDTFNKASLRVNGKYKEIKKLHDGSILCGKIWFASDENTQPSSVTFLDDVNMFLLRSILSFKSDGGIELEGLFDNKSYFSYPKPTKLLRVLISSYVNGESDTVLDFFAGSGTTGDAVMQLNAEDGGKRKFILAQLPELIDNKKNKAAYDFVKNKLNIETPTIFDITKERLIRASKKIQEENKEKDLTKQDLGFKVFETMPIWENYNFESEELEKQISLFDENILTKEDIKALLATWKTYDGISLTESIQETDLNGYTAHYSNEKLYLMDKGFTTENLKALLEKIDSDKSFNPTTIIAFGYHFESKNLREISENIKSYTNKKSIDIDFITRY
ncbi:site-specific DNA-methyltransferase [Putridiphycobacter roseus]|uniref:site-specific DNA-methyltransferase (adenine-specific) n=1 Tax=Putridiphycobacter roseus TaxID=2219161 RepID=A0A2W1MYJ3_9FLAO|nr:site-specific DNA-methyltransferase [Putridiphycobacter roseus]PZE15621.1 site-specific DNA-methyltransferase [Putridiphycobacter roseus]